MQESAVRRMATVNVIRHTIDNMSDLVGKQFDLTGMEIREGFSNVFTGIRFLIVGLAGLILMSTALGLAVVLELSLLSARAAFFLMGKGYQMVIALEGRLQGRRSEDIIPSDAPEIA